MHIVEKSGNRCTSVSLKTGIVQASARLRKREKCRKHLLQAILINVKELVTR